VCTLLSILFCSEDLTDTTQIEGRSEPSGSHSNSPLHNEKHTLLTMLYYSSKGLGIVLVFSLLPDLLIDTLVLLLNPLLGLVDSNLYHHPGVLRSEDGTELEMSTKEDIEHGPTGECSREVITYRSSYGRAGMCGLYRGIIDRRDSR
jgi:hypothetical protein